MSTLNLSSLNTFPARLEHFRGTATKAAFSKRIGISAPLYTQWMQGASPTYDKVRLIAKCLNVTPDWLLTGQEEATPDSVHEPACNYPNGYDVETEIGKVNSRLSVMEGKLDTLVRLLGASLRVDLSDQNETKAG